MEVTRSIRPEREPVTRDSNQRLSSPEAAGRKNALMFDRIARHYDLLNRLLSFRRDVSWRRKMAAGLPASPDLQVLDVAAGTADSLISLAAHCDRLALGIGLDPADQMLAIGRSKLTASGYTDRLYLVRGDGCAIPFADGSFDAVTIAFGIRNFADPAAGLREFCRVLKPGGRLLVLEFSLPSNALLKSLYLAYFRYLMPVIGRVISGDSAAYRHLNRSVESFPYGQRFCELMQAAGFHNIRQQLLTFGVATIYSGHKAASQARRPAECELEAGD